jgi:hypothetical protein
MTKASIPPLGSHLQGDLRQTIHHWSLNSLLYKMWILHLLHKVTKIKQDEWKAHSMQELTGWSFSPTLLFALLLPFHLLELSWTLRDEWLTLPYLPITTGAAHSWIISLFIAVTIKKKLAFLYISLFLKHFLWHNFTFYKWHSNE